MVKRYVVVMSDEELLQDLAKLRLWHLELGDWREAYDRSEWGGRAREEAYADVHLDLIEAIDECKRRGLDWARVVYPHLYPGQSK